MVRVIKNAKGISYDDVQEKDVIDYLDTKENFSRYILSLVRNDIIQNNKIQVAVDYLYAKCMSLADTEQKSNKVNSHNHSNTKA